MNRAWLQVLAGRTWQPVRLGLPCSACSMLAGTSGAGVGLQRWLRLQQTIHRHARSAAPVWHGPTYWGTHAPSRSIARKASEEAPAPSSSSPSSMGGSDSTSKQTVLTLPTMLTLGRVVAVPMLIAAWYWPSGTAGAACASIFAAASLTDWLDGYLARKLVRGACPAEPHLEAPAEPEAWGRGVSAVRRLKLGPRGRAQQAGRERGHAREAAQPWQGDQHCGVGASSAFGAFLDPVADKLMVAAVLILLSTQPLAAGPLAGNAWLLPVCALLIIGREITMSALREWAATLGPAARDAVAVSSWGKLKTATQMVSLTLLLATRDGASGGLLQVAATVAPPLLGVATYLTLHSLALYVKGLWRFFF